jgi:uncharacterized protein
VRHVIDTNVTGTIYLIQHVARDMRRRGAGRILVTGSIAGFMPGTFHAVYSFAFALRAELKETGVTVTCLMPGVTDTDFFERADLVVSGWKNKLQSAIANVTPAGVLAEQHRRMTEPGSGQEKH